VHRLTGLNESGKMKDAVEGLPLLLGRNEKGFQSGPISQLSFDEFHSRRQKLTPAMAQIVKNNDLMSFFG
jgi:hypothetical protein